MLSSTNKTIYGEQVRLIYNRGTLGIALSMLGALFVCVLFWQVLPVESLVLWLTALGCVAIARLWVIFLYLKTTKYRRQSCIWGALFVLGATVSGCLWGAWPVYFYAYFNAEHLILMSMAFLVGIACYANASNVYLPAFFAFAVPSVLLWSVMHVGSDNDTLRLLAPLQMVFLSMIGFTAFKGNRLNRAVILTKLENKNTREKLEYERSISERADQAKSRFLASASHDMRQPLHAIGLFLSALQARERNPGKLGIIRDLKKSAEALDGLFSSFLDVSRLDADVIEFNPIHIKASGLFETLRAQIEHQAATKNIELRIRDEQHVLYCDPVLLERILRNLLSNAVQHTNTGYISLSCEASSDGKNLIKIEDSGIGIPHGSLDDIFLEYFQLDNSAHVRKKGLGLGLSIVHRLCAFMDLPLDVKSTEGVGTVFSVTVPAGDQTRIPLVDDQTRRYPPEGLLALVIDDDLQVLQAMRLMLEARGCRALLAESSGHAIKAVALEERVPDIVICDYALGNNLSGLDAVEAVREALEQTIPAIIVTGDTSAQRLRLVKEAGLSLLHKPVQPEQLDAFIERLAGKTKHDTKSVSTQGMIDQRAMGG